MTELVVKQVEGAVIKAGINHVGWEIKLIRGLVGVAIHNIDMRIKRRLTIIGYNNDGDSGIFNEQGTRTDHGYGKLTIGGQMRCLIRAVCRYGDTAKRSEEG